MTQIAEAHGVKSEVTYTRSYPPTVNTSAETQLIHRVASEVIGEENLLSNLEPSAGADDFAFFLLEKPGAYLWLGAGRSDEDNPALHTARYDFNDEIISNGIEILARTALAALDADIY